MATTVGTNEQNTKWIFNVAQTNVTPAGKVKTLTLNTGGQFVDKDIEIIISATAKQGSIGTTGEDPGVEYTENKTAAVPVGGYLVIGGGYIEPTKISLSTLIPDIEGAGAIAADSLRQGEVAFDKDGNAIVGTMADVIVEKTEGTVEATAKAVPNGLSADTYSTEATSGYTHRIDVNATATIGASSINMTKGYNPEEQTITLPKKTETVTSSIYLIEGQINNNYSGGQSSGTITAGRQIKIGKGYYPNDIFYDTQSVADMTPADRIADVAVSISSGFNTPSAVEEMPIDRPYITLTGKATTTDGYITAGTDTKDKFILVYKGDFEEIENSPA